MEVLEQRCDECGRPPRRLSLEIKDLLFCQRDCYLAHCAREWEQLFSKTFSQKQAQKLEVHKGARSA